MCRRRRRPSRYLSFKRDHEQQAFVARRERNRARRRARAHAAVTPLSMIEKTRCLARCRDRTGRRDSARIRTAIRPRLPDRRTSSTGAAPQLDRDRARSTDRRNRSARCAAGRLIFDGDAAAAVERLRAGDVVGGQRIAVAEDRVHQRRRRSGRARRDDRGRARGRARAARRGRCPTDRGRSRSARCRDTSPLERGVEDHVGFDALRCCRSSSAW